MLATPPFPDRLEAARRYADTRVIRAQLVATITALMDTCEEPAVTAELIAAATYDAAVASLEQRLQQPGARHALAAFMADLALGPELGR